VFATYMSRLGLAGDQQWYLEGILAF
jgi:hypothetical protein